MYVCMYVCVYIYIYIYIYSRPDHAVELHEEDPQSGLREAGSHARKIRRVRAETKQLPTEHIYVYIYIYRYVYIDIYIYTCMYV